MTSFMRIMCIHEKQNDLTMTNSNHFWHFAKLQKVNLNFIMPAYPSTWYN